MNILLRILSILGFVSMLVVSAPSVGVMAATDLNQNILPVSQENNNKKAEIDFQIKSTKKSRGVSATATCDADACVRVGDVVEILHTCTFPDPRVVMTCVLVSAPSGTTFSVNQGNPAVGTAIWTARAPGIYTFSAQAVVVSCPVDLTCDPSAVESFTVKVVHPSQEEQEEARSKLPDPSACNNTISPECHAAKTECVRLLGGAREAECHDMYPVGSKFEEEFPQIYDPKVVCKNTWSLECQEALHFCEINGGGDFCINTYPFGSVDADFLETRPPGACEGDGLFGAQCEQFRRECQLFGFPDAFCNTNYPQPSSDEAILILVDPSGDACDDPSSDTCERAQRACIARGADEAFCKREFPAT